MTRATIEVSPLFFLRFPSIWELNPFTTGNPFLGAKLLGFSIGRGSGALKGSPTPKIKTFHYCGTRNRRYFWVQK